MALFLKNINRLIKDPIIEKEVYMSEVNQLSSQELNQELIQEVKKRRTFAIISHPDAGKTTLTEKFLLYGGAIREAGTVKSRKSQKHAVSDWKIGRAHV